MEPACGKGGLPPWGGPALLSGNGVKPQEWGGRQQEASLCWAGSQPVLQRRGWGAQGVRTVSPPPGPGGQPGGPPSPPSLDTGEGLSQTLPRALPPPGHQPGRDPSPRGRLRPRPLQADPGHTCLSPAAPAQRQPALSTAGLWVLASFWAAGTCTVTRGRRRGLAGVLSRTSSVPRVPPWGAGLQGATARWPVSAAGPAPLACFPGRKACSDRLAHPSRPGGL